MKIIKRFLIFLILIELGTIITFTTLTLLKRKEIKQVIDNYIIEIEENSNKRITNVSDIDINLDKKPTEGWTKIENGKVIEYSLKYDGYVIDLEKENVTFSKDGSIRIIPEIIIKIGEDNVLTPSDKIIFKYGDKEYSFEITETNEEKTTIQSSEKVNVEDLKEKGFKSIIDYKQESDKTIIYLKTENLK